MADPLKMLTTEPVYKELQALYDQQGKDINMKNLFDKDPERFNKYRFVKIFEVCNNTRCLKHIDK